METEKTAAVKTAHALGFDAIHFADAMEPVGFSAPVDPRSVLEDATSIAVLFKSYRASAPAVQGQMPLSPYYPASHFAYHAAKAFTAFLCARGFGAVHTPSLPAKAAALKTGGFIGNNGFYHHPRLGSLVCIQTVVTNAFMPDSFAPDGTACLKCGACQNACPSGGVGDLEKCLRFHNEGLIPEARRGDIYQLIGCERCQTACPQNPKELSPARGFAIAGLLNGSLTLELKHLIGAPMARPRRIASQAALYAANTGQQQYAPQLRRLAESADEPLRTHARWAYQKLTGEIIT